MAQPQTREALERRADAARVSGQADQALHLYQELIRQDLAGGRIAKAVSVYQKLLVWRPEDSALHRVVSQMIAQARDGVAPVAAAPSAPPNVLFSGVPAEELSGVLEKMEAAHFAAGSKIVSEGDPGNSLFLISDGLVSVHTRDRGVDIELATLGAGDFFGEVSLLTARPRTATVVAETAVDVLELSRARVDELRSRFPDIEQVLTEFHRLRAEKTVEALIERRQRD
jgi:CRP-like cAMP-binding protein